MNFLSRRQFGLIAGFSTGMLIAKSAPALTLRRDLIILVILWRGETSSELGFYRYLSLREIKIEYIVRDAAQSRTKLLEILAEAQNLVYDLVYIFGTEATLAAVGTTEGQRGGLTGHAPVVFVSVGDPVGVKIVDNLVGHGRNITGVVHLPSITTQLEVMRSYFSPKRIGVLFNRSESYGLNAIQQLKLISVNFGIELVIAGCNDNEGAADINILDESLKIFSNAGIDLLFIPSTSYFIPYAKRITERINQLRIPTFCANEQLIRDGDGLVGLVSSSQQVGSFAAYKVEEILIKKKNIESVPIERLASFSLLINHDTSVFLKIYPPAKMLRYAEVIKHE